MATHESTFMGYRFISHFCSDDAPAVLHITIHPGFGLGWTDWAIPCIDLSTTRVCHQWRSAHLEMKAD